MSITCYCFYLEFIKEWVYVLSMIILFYCSIIILFITLFIEQRLGNKNRNAKSSNLRLAAAVSG